MEEGIKARLATIVSRQTGLANDVYIDLGTAAEPRHDVTLESRDGTTQVGAVEALAAIRGQSDEWVAARRETLLSPARGISEIMSEFGPMTTMEVLRLARGTLPDDPIASLEDAVALDARNRSADTQHAEQAAPEPGAPASQRMGDGSGKARAAKWPNVSLPVGLVVGEPRLRVRKDGSPVIGQDGSMVHDVVARIPDGVRLGEVDLSGSMLGFAISGSLVRRDESGHARVARQRPDGTPIRSVRILLDPNRPVDLFAYTRDDGGESTRHVVARVEGADQLWGLCHAIAEVKRDWESERRQRVEAARATSVELNVPASKVRGIGSYETKSGRVAKTVSMRLDGVDLLGSSGDGWIMTAFIGDDAARHVANGLTTKVRLSTRYPLNIYRKNEGRPGFTRLEPRVEGEERIRALVSNIERAWAGGAGGGRETRERHAERAIAPASDKEPGAAHGPKSPSREDEDLDRS